MGTSKQGAHRLSSARRCPSAARVFEPLRALRLFKGREREREIYIYIYIEVGVDALEREIYIYTYICICVYIYMYVCRWGYVGGTNGHIGSKYLPL